MEPTHPHTLSPACPVLYRDDWILAVDKPAGIIVHGDGTGSPTLTDMVRARLIAERHVDAAHDLQCLQRLDRDTTGIVLFSINKRFQPAFDRLIAERGLTKRYLAVAQGRIFWSSRTFVDPLGRDRHDSRRMRVNPRGVSARTEAERLAVFPATTAHGERTLLAVRIQTGRKHQIRVHLSHAGHPIVGDALYGRPDPAGLLLQAHELSFMHPVALEQVTITAPTPAWAQTNRSEQA